MADIVRWGIIRDARPDKTVCSPRRRLTNFSPVDSNSDTANVIRLEIDQTYRIGLSTLQTAGLEIVFLSTAITA